MNVQPKRSSLIPETVTTGPLTGSHKVYYSPAGRPEIRVPFREILGIVRRYGGVERVKERAQAFTGIYGAVEREATAEVNGAGT